MKNINCIHFKKHACHNKNRRWFFKLFSDSFCCELNNKKCDLKEEHKRPELRSSIWKN